MRRALLLVIVAAGCGRTGLVEDPAFVIPRPHGFPDPFASPSPSPTSTPAGGLLETGSYLGDGADDRAITGLAAAPDVVFVKGSAAVEAVVRTSTMSGDASKPLGGVDALTANLIQSLDAGGFTVGSDPRVNQAGVVYHWVAFRAIAGQVFVGSFAGTDQDERSLTGFGFSPEVAMAFPQGAGSALYSSSTMGGTSYRSDGSALGDGGIQLLESDGIQVGNETTFLNVAGGTDHVVGWNEMPGVLKTGSYSGDASDPRALAGVGFQPWWVVVKNQGSQLPAHRPGSFAAAADASMSFGADADAPNLIQALAADGFELGSAARVNATGQTYHYFAFY